MRRLMGDRAGVGLEPLGPVGDQGRRNTALVLVLLVPAERCVAALRPTPRVVVVDVGAADLVDPLQVLVDRDPLDRLQRAAELLAVQSADQRDDQARLLVVLADQRTFQPAENLLVLEVGLGGLGRRARELRRRREGAE